MKSKKEWKKKIIRKLNKLIKSAIYGLPRYMTLDEELNELKGKCEGITDKDELNKILSKYAIMKEFRSERQKKRFARLVGLWVIFKNENTVSDLEIKIQMMWLYSSESIEYDFKGDWEECQTYEELKEWYLRSVNDG